MNAKQIFPGREAVEPSEADRIADERRRERLALSRANADAARNAAEARRERKAAKRRATPGLLVLAVALLALAGCGTSALTHHVTAARASRTVIEGTSELIDGVCSAERSRAMGLAGVSAEEHAQHVARCDTARTRNAEARAAWSAYVASALEAAVLEAGSDPLEWGVAFARAYGHVATALRALGVRAPALPGGVLELLGDAGDVRRAEVATGDPGGDED